MLVGQHAAHRLLRHQKAAEGADRDGLGYIGRDQIGECAPRPPAGIVDDEVGRADLAFDQAEQALDFLRIGGIAGKGAGAGLGAERAELFDLARGQRHLDALARKQPRQRCAKTFAGADDQGVLVFWRFHARVP
jgi:hypothetical protein